MMRPADRHVQNRIQNVLIVCLVLSALFLLSRTELIGPDTFNRLFTSSVYSTENTSASQTSAQLPVRIAVRTGGVCQAWTGETTGGNVFEDLGPLLTEALGSASDGRTVDEKEFQRALENNSIYYDFTTTLPLSLLDAWIGGSANAPQTPARALLLSSLQDGSVTLYGWDPEHDAYYCWSTTVTAETLSSAAERHSGESAEFAFLSGESYQALAPYTLISQARQTLPELSVASVLSSAECDQILMQLEFNVHSNSRYTESDSTLVIKQGLRTIRFEPDGTVYYSGTEADAAVLRPKHSGEAPTLQECTDAAWECISAITADRIGDARLYLLSAQADQNGNAEIQFGYMLGGFPIFHPDDITAQVTVEEGVITSFTVHLRSYTSSEKSTALLPTLQAAAAVRSDGPAELLAGYWDDGNDTLSPTWLQK